MTFHGLSEIQMHPCMLMTRTFGISHEKSPSWMRPSTMTLCRLKNGWMVTSFHLMSWKLMPCLFPQTKAKSSERWSESLKLKIRDSELEVVQKTKYLVVQIDSTLDVKEHVKTVLSRVSRAISLLKHAKSFLPEGTLNTGTQVHRYCGATRSLLLFSLGLLWCDGDQALAKITKSCCTYCNWQQLWYPLES